MYGPEMRLLAHDAALRKVDPDCVAFMVGRCRLKVIVNRVKRAWFQRLKLKYDELLLTLL